MSGTGDTRALRPCCCSIQYNLPMFMENERGQKWIECDFCGKRTAYHQWPVNAVKQWTLIARS